MNKETLLQNCQRYLKTLCQTITERAVGSIGNTQATDFFAQELAKLHWHVDTTELQVIDWEDGGAHLCCCDNDFTVLVSPYAIGCDVIAPLVAISSVEQLREAEIFDNIAFLHGEIAQEQLMPKNFVFYNPDEHKEIISLLEEKAPAAIIAATSRNAALAGGVYPFPLIEDGDFNIPALHTTESEGSKILQHNGEVFTLNSYAKRIPSRAWNVIARKCFQQKKRIVISAHIDAKKGTPGALDNATGVVVLLLLAQLLEDYNGSYALELVAFNGEDYYSAPGQIIYLAQNANTFNDIVLNINLDGAGYKQGDTAFSLFDLPEDIHKAVMNVIEQIEGIVEGELWYQGDHSMFVQQGCPAVAITSQYFLENIASQTITHTPADNIDIIDCNKLVGIAHALHMLIRSFG